MIFCGRALTRQTANLPYIKSGRWIDITGKGQWFQQFSGFLTQTLGFGRVGLPLFLACNVKGTRDHGGTGYPSLFRLQLRRGPMRIKMRAVFATLACVALLAGAAGAKET